PDSLAGFIARVNQIRRANSVLSSNRNLLFHPVDNEELICYSKHADDHREILLMVVNLDPYHRQAGFAELPLDELKLDADHPYQVHDLLTDSRFLWHGSRNYVELVPD